MMGSLSMSLIEAARIDGKSEMGIFHSIALPLSMPGIATISIVPIMIMFAVFSKYMIEGIAAGGVKE
jgi:ABC-type glycerol-3-phosphate transport system permease component